MTDPIDVYSFDLTVPMYRLIKFKGPKGEIMEVGSTILIFPRGHYERFKKLLDQKGIDLDSAT